MEGKKVSKAGWLCWSKKCFWSGYKLVLRRRIGKAIGFCAARESKTERAHCGNSIRANRIHHATTDPWDQTKTKLQLIK